MKYVIEINETSELLVLRLEGDVDYSSLQKAIFAADEFLEDQPNLNMVINGNLIERFNIPNHVCQQVAPSLFKKANACAFFSSAPLAFGMARVIQTYSFNNAFAVYKSFEEALSFVKADQKKQYVQ